MMSAGQLLIGRFGRPHGVQGWLSVISHTDPETNIFDYQSWVYRTPKGVCELLIEDQNVAGKKLLVKLQGVEDREQIVFVLCKL